MREPNAQRLTHSTWWAAWCDIDGRHPTHDYQHEEMTWRIGFPTIELAVEFPAEYPFQPPAVRCTAPFPQTNLFINPDTGEFRIPGEPNGKSYEALMGGSRGSSWGPSVTAIKMLARAVDILAGRILAGRILLAWQRLHLATGVFIMAAE